MVSAYADTSFLASILLEEARSATADGILTALTDPLFLTDLSVLETRNALNLAIVRGRITATERDTAWRHFEAQRQAGVFQDRFVDTGFLFQRARELSDRYTPSLATRSLDLLHVAAALLLNADEFLSFDDRQRRVAVAEGLKVRP